MSYSIGIYLRLSDDDIETGQTESNSISGQRSIIKEFISNNPELCNHKVIEYCDDGYTGVNFNRPSVKKLFDAVKNGNVQCVIVKDLSRFGRNVVEVGNYVEQIFPLLGVRFISINDNFDSSKVKGAIDTGFALHNIMNASYSIDISSKVKAVKKIHKAKGYFMGGNAPYGYYIKNKQLYVDQQVSDIVKRIFLMAGDKKSYKLIAQTLNKEGIATIKEYRGHKSKTNLWTPKSISGIVNNPVYVGTLVNNKSETISPRISKTNNESNWLIFENHHEAIVSQELFEKANHRHKKHSSVNSITKTNLYPEFKGKVFCGGCGNLLQRYYITSKGDLKRTFYYTCRFDLNDSCCCERVYIEDLKAIVLKSLVVQIKLVVKDYTLLLNSITDKQALTNVTIEKLTSEISRLENRKLILYTEFKKGMYTKDEFIVKREQLIDKLHQLENEKELTLRNSPSITDLEKVMLFLDNYKNNIFTQETLIEKYLKAVYIHPHKRIEVIWSFEDVLK